MKKFKNRMGDQLFEKTLRVLEKYHCYTKLVANSSDATMPPKESFRTDPALSIKMYLEFLYVLYAKKYTELTGTLIDSVNDEKYLVFALCGRSLIEVTAYLRYYTEEITLITDEVRKTGQITSNQIESIINTSTTHVTGTRFGWLGFFLNKRWLITEKEIQNKEIDEFINLFSDDSRETIFPKQNHISKVERKWTKDFPNIESIYAYFSELVHPNMGHNFLFMDPESNGLSVGKYSKKEAAKDLCMKGLDMLICNVIKEGIIYMRNLRVMKKTEYPPPKPNKNKMSTSPKPR